MWPLPLSTTIVVQLLLITCSSLVTAQDVPSPQVQALVNQMFDEGRALIDAHQQLYLETLYRHFGDRLFGTSLTVMLHDLNLIPFSRTGRYQTVDQVNRDLNNWRANNNLERVRAWCFDIFSV